ncbi:MAG: hypothetical protein M3250_04695 [Thermoproteota archaeon]|nr:hypothetical protein [Thermoproteota archaeon]
MFISKSIEAVDGSIWVQNNRTRKESSFSFSLPHFLE